MMYNPELDGDIQLFKELAKRVLDAVEQAHSINAQSMLLFVAGGLADAAESFEAYKEEQPQHGNN